MADLIRQSIFERFVVQQKSVFDQTQGQTKEDKNFQVGQYFLMPVLAEKFYPRIKTFRGTKLFLTVPRCATGEVA